MSEQATHKDDFLASLDRCCESSGFIPEFYSRFMQSSEEVRLKFRFTDFATQNAMLVESLRLIASATAGEPAGLQQLKALAQSHDRDHRDIRPELYEIWLNSVIDTAGDFDPLWDHEIEVSWRSVLSHAVNYMVRRY